MNFRHVPIGDNAVDFVSKGWRYNAVYQFLRFVLNWVGDTYSGFVLPWYGREHSCVTRSGNNLPLLCWGSLKRACTFCLQWPGWSPDLEERNATLRHCPCVKTFSCKQVKMELVWWCQKCCYIGASKSGGKANPKEVYSQWSNVRVNPWRHGKFSQKEWSTRTSIFRIMFLKWSTK